jgi:hypothetical protein
LKLPNGESGAVEAARWDYSGDASPVGQARIEYRRLLEDVIAQETSDVLDGDLEVAFLEVHTSNSREQACTLDKDGL